MKPALIRVAALAMSLSLFPALVIAGTVCLDPLLYRAKFETLPQCGMESQPLSNLEQALVTTEPVAGCVPPGVNNGVAYCQGFCGDGSPGCDVEFSSSNGQVNVSDDLVCFDALIVLPAVDLNLGPLSCTMSLDILGSNVAALDGTYSDVLTWQFASSVSDFVVDEVLIDGCDILAGVLDDLVTELTPELEAQGAIAADALLGGLAGTAYCPVDSLHPDFIGPP